jgi:hypothetical protein
MANLNLTAGPAQALSEQELFSLVNKIIDAQHRKEITNALERQKFIMRELGADRQAVDGFGRVTAEMDPYLAWTIKQNHADADGTQHDEVLRDPVMHRVLEREGIEVRVKDHGTTTARVGYKPTVDYSYQDEGLGSGVSGLGVRVEGGERAVRFRKTYAAA